MFVLNKANKGFFKKRKIQKISKWGNKLQVTQTGSSACYVFIYF